MRKRMLVGLVLALFGLALIVGTVVAGLLGSTLGAQFWIGIIAGAVCLVVGVGLAAVELIESFLGRGSTALVDGLQAG